MDRKNSAAPGMKDGDSVLRTEAEDDGGNRKRKKQKTEGSIHTKHVSPFDMAEIKVREEADKRKKKIENKEKKGSDKFRDLDDGEASDMDLFVSAEDTPAEEDSVARQRARRAAHGEDTFFGGLIIDPAKKKKKKDKKALNTVKGASALELLQSSGEIGTGRRSTHMGLVLLIDIRALSAE